MASACFSSRATSVSTTRPALLSVSKSRKSLSFSECSLLSSRLPSKGLCCVRSPTCTPLPRSWNVSRAQYELESLEATDSLEDNSPPQTLPSEGSKLYVGNLSFNCTSQDLAEYFQSAGTVEMVEVILDRETQRSRGFAFVTMRTMEEANEAISRFDGGDFMGRRLRVGFPDRSRNDGPRQPLSNVNKLFVGNLPWGMDDITLENLFAEHGKVLDARVIYDRETGRSRGFGFVTLSSSDEVSEAISKMDGAQVEGRPLRVNLASDRPPPRPTFM
ncbi:hypothetical protein KP509_11G096500 [Ceratopteris richardii]|uniref:RRM domain-containing protein n=1 Tax=Ceratopteris richardii TaxID=49495 RepID=A0A8T2TXL3_CERRI|nr:hypothetical protein KP509_11G096500 [Ceratopteris richardii]